jgi:hypothetical protein
MLYASTSYRTTGRYFYKIYRSIEQFARKLQRRTNIPLLLKMTVPTLYLLKDQCSMLLLPILLLFDTSTKFINIEQSAWKLPKGPTTFDLCEFSTVIMVNSSKTCRSIDQ